MKPKDVSLVLFLTRNVPMEIWRKTGSLQRETSYYKELATRLHQIYFVTYGGKSELDLAPAINNFSLLYNESNISPNLYSLIAPYIHRKELSQAKIYKTNQLDGAWTAIIAGWMFHKPVIVRAGYIWSDVFRQEISKGLKAYIVEKLEKWCLRQARCIFVTTQEIKDRYCIKYRLSNRKITVIPNFIDTAIFHPDPQIKPIKGRICFVGRLAPIKNLDLLIQAIAQIPSASLIIIGRGKQLDELKSLSERLHANVEFLGQVENRELPMEIQKSEIFVLPSTLEGHPKALIEAMACGCAVIGTDVPGIHNLIRHKENGLLCPPSVDGVRDAIVQVLEDDNLRENIGKNAALFAASAFSLEKIADLETQAILHCFVEGVNKDK